MKTTLTISGKPVPQGSMTASPFMDGKTGRMRASMRPNNARDLYYYRADIQSAWEHTIPEPPIIEGPVILNLKFVFARPQSHYLPVNKKRSEPELRADAPEYVQGHPDLDKLCRSVMDALTQRAYKDDKQVVRLNASKAWGPMCYTTIEVEDF